MKYEFENLDQAGCELMGAAVAAAVSVAALLALGVGLAGCGPRPGEMVDVRIAGVGPQRTSGSSRATDCKVDKLFVTVRGPGMYRMRIPVTDATFNLGGFGANSIEGNGDSDQIQTGTLTIPARVVKLPVGLHRVVGFVGRISLDGSCAALDEGYPIYGESAPINLPTASDIVIPVHVYSAGVGAANFTFGGWSPTGEAEFQQVDFTIPAGVAGTGTCQYHKAEIWDITADGLPFLLTAPTLNGSTLDETGSQSQFGTGIAVRGLSPLRRYDMRFKPAGGTGCTATDHVIRLVFKTVLSDKQLGTTGSPTHSSYTATCTVSTDVLSPVSVLTDTALHTAVCAKD